MSEFKSKEIVVSGMRPTGSLHLGHYVGALKNWASLQNDFQCYFFLADLHAVTSNYEKLDVIREMRFEYIKGYIASGVDPSKVVFYNQSDHPEVLFLNQFFLSLTPPGWADRSPSWKDLKANPNKVLDNLGFYTYPILQTADISILKGKRVPVGEDQVSHVEIAREIVRKFNRTYKANLPEPEALLTDIPRLPGLDGKKMSSSKGNLISLRETEKSLQKKINKMKTDDERGGVENPGNPDNCSVFDYHKVFSPAPLREEISSACKEAQLSCGECKQKLGECMKELVMPMAEKMNSISNQDCLDILQEGNKVASIEMKKNWAEIQEKIKFN